MTVLACSLPLVTLAVIWYASRGAERGIEQGVPSQLTMSQVPSFRSISIFDGTREDGVPFSNEVYRASDCQTVISRVEILKSPERAGAQLENERKRADQVLEQGPKFDNTGQQIGQRLKLVFANNLLQRQYSVLWTNNSKLHSITSSSLEDVEALEKWFMQPGSFRKESLQNGGSNELFFQPGSTHSGVREGVSYQEQQFESSDCERVLSRIEYLETPARAKELLQSRIKSAVQIIEKGTTKNAEGKQPGERVVIVFAPESHEFRHTFAVIWIEDSALHSIESMSLSDVLQFEKKHQP